MRVLNRVREQKIKYDAMGQAYVTYKGHKLYLHEFIKCNIYKDIDGIMTDSVHSCFGIKILGDSAKVMYCKVS